MSAKSSELPSIVDARVVSCPVCDRRADHPFVHIGSQPAHCNILWGSKEAALSAPRGDLDLSFCSSCGHVFNVSFDSTLTNYGGTYENSLHHSPVFQEYAADLVADLVERHDLRGRDIVEIGAGQGDFLQMLCAGGVNRGVGFDPSHIGATESSDGVRVVAAFYGEEFADYPADLIVCRHVLEHVERAGDFISMVRRVVGPRDSDVFFEVPDAMWTLAHGGVWDLIYEHCAYFTSASLSETFRRAGFHVERVNTVFGNQFLTLEATPADSIDPAPTNLDDEISIVAAATEMFAVTYRTQVEYWREQVAALTSRGDRLVIWGAGSKGVTFLNTIAPDGSVEYAVDINPRKRGKFIAGSGQQIVGPHELKDLKPRVVLIMNPNYQHEVEATLDQLGVAAKVVVV